MAAPKRIGLKLLTDAPGPSFRAAALLDAAAGPLRRRPPPAAPEVRGLPLPDPDLAVQTPWTSSLGHALLTRALWNRVTLAGLDVVALPGLAQIRPPMVLATLHAGPLIAVGVLVERLAGESLVFLGEPAADTGFTTASVGATETERAATVLRAHRLLERGGFVLLPVDGNRSPRLRMPLLDRSLAVGKGAFALSRMSGAPIAPVLPRWLDGRTSVLVGPPIPAADEQTMATALGQWFDRQLRSTPMALGPTLVNWLLRSPRTRAAGRPEPA